MVQGLLKFRVGLNSFARFCGLLRFNFVVALWNLMNCFMGCLVAGFVKTLLNLLCEFLCLLGLNLALCGCKCAVIVSNFRKKRRYVVIASHFHKNGVAIHEKSSVAINPKFCHFELLGQKSISLLSYWALAEYPHFNFMDTSLSSESSVWQCERVLDISPKAQYDKRCF